MKITATGVQTFTAGFILVLSAGTSALAQATVTACGHRTLYEGVRS